MNYKGSEANLSWKWEAWEQLRVRDDRELQVTWRLAGHSKTVLAVADLGGGRVASGSEVPMELGLGLVKGEAPGRQHPSRSLILMLTLSLSLNLGLNLILILILLAFALALTFALTYANCNPMRLC